MKRFLILIWCAVTSQAAILTTNLEMGVTQLDGRAEVTETHVDQLGARHVFVYLSADSNATRTNTMIARVVTLEPALRVDEINRILSGALPPTQNHSTKQQLLDEFRERYRIAVGVETGRLAKWLLDRQDAGDWNDTQLANAFSVSGASWTLIKARMITLRQRYNDLMDAQGE